MQYGLALNYVFARTGGLVNLLLITVCNLIPVVGPIVTLGYRAEVAQALLRDSELRRHPKFEFERFVEYLTRGLWPFVIGLIVGVAMVPLFLVFVVGAVLLGAAVKEPAIGMIAGYGLGGITMIVVALLAAPMTFHAELTNKFDLGEGFRFMKSFWSTAGGAALVAMLIFIPISFAVAIAGLLLCFVGVYPASALLEMAGQHLMVQLYQEYLDRGGEPIRQYEAPAEEDDDEDRPRRRRRRRDEDDDEADPEDDERDQS